MHRRIVRSTLKTKPKYDHTEYYYMVGKWVVTYSKGKDINTYTWIQSKESAKYEIDWKAEEWKKVKEMPDKEECIKFVFRWFRKTR